MAMRQSRIRGGFRNRLCKYGEKYQITQQDSLKKREYRNRKMKRWLLRFLRLNDLLMTQWKWEDSFEIPKLVTFCTALISTSKKYFKVPNENFVGIDIWKKWNEFIKIQAKIRSTQLSFVQKQLRKNATRLSNKCTTTIKSRPRRKPRMKCFKSTCIHPAPLRPQRNA